MKYINSGGNLYFTTAEGSIPILSGVETELSPEVVENPIIAQLIEYGVLKPVEKVSKPTVSEPTTNSISDAPSV